MDDQTLTWRVPPAIIGAKIAAMTIFIIAAWFFSGNNGQLVVAIAAATILGAYAAADLIKPIKICAYPSGLYVAQGIFGSRYLDWEEIEVIRVDNRRRLAGTSRALEIDIGSTLFLFGKSQIGEEPEKAATKLQELWSHSRKDLT